jgi:hypothetical protein
LIKKWSCCTLLQVFQVQIFSNVFYPQKKLWGTKQNKPDLSSRSKNEILNAEKKPIRERENSCSQPPSSRINVVCIISPTKNCQKGRKEIDLCPTFMSGKCSQASTVAPSIRWRVN